MKYFIIVVFSFLFSFGTQAAGELSLRFNRFATHHTTERFAVDCNGKKKECFLVQLLNEKVQTVANIPLDEVKKWIAQFDKEVNESNAPKRVPKDAILSVSYTKPDGTLGMIGYDRQTSLDQKFPKLSLAFRHIENSLWEAAEPSL